MLTLYFGMLQLQSLYSIEVVVAATTLWEHVTSSDMMSSRVFMRCVFVHPTFTQAAQIPFTFEFSVRTVYYNTPPHKNSIWASAPLPVYHSCLYHFPSQLQFQLGTNRNVFRTGNHGSSLPQWSIQIRGLEIVYWKNTFSLWCSVLLSIRWYVIIAI